MKEVKIQKIPPLECTRPTCKSKNVGYNKGIIWCMECGKFLDPDTGKYKDFNRGITVGGGDHKRSDVDNNYDVDNPRKIGTTPVVKEVKF